MASASPTSCPSGTLSPPSNCSPTAPPTSTAIAGGVFAIRLVKLAAAPADYRQAFSFKDH